MLCFSDRADLVLSLSSNKLFKIDLGNPLSKLDLYRQLNIMEVIIVTFFLLFPPPFQVTHVEPWEKGSRKTAGQTGMCGGVSRSTCLLKFFCVW